MNNILAFIIVLLPLAVCAQVRVVSEPETVETVELYDSTNNCPKYQITGFVGQELFLSPQPDYLKKYGYQDIYRSETSHVGSIPCDEIAGHTFKVTNVKSNDKYRNFYNMQLKDTVTGSYYYYTYSVDRKSWPFITLGYKEKYESANKGKNFVSLSYYLGKDFNTGEYLTGKTRGTIWTFQEIISNKDDGEIGYLYTNNKGQTIVISEHYVKDMKPKHEIDKLRKKYGKRMCDVAIEGKINVGMPEELVRIAKGNPRSINRASYGEQWVYGEYGDDCVYIKHGKVTAWN